MAAAAQVLYISYDGMTDQLGRSQVLPYLLGLAADGHRITLLTAEKADRLKAEGEHVRRLCEAAGIDWQAVRYRRRPPVLSTVIDAAEIYRAAARLHRQRCFDLVHGRSYIPALVGLRLKRRFGIRFLFDMRGFWADERVDAGLWDLANPLYRTIFRYFKRKESEFLAEADHIVSLTGAGRDVLLDWRGGAAEPPVSVIPCCVDLAAFPAITDDRRRQARTKLDIPADSRVACYLGSTRWYMLDEMLDFFAVQRERDPGAIFLFVTRDDPGRILASAKAKGIPEAALRIRGADRQEVPIVAAAADYALFFRTPAFANAACSPTRLGEFLAMELPVVVNGGVGDVERIMVETGAGMVVDRFEPLTYAAALDRIERGGFDMDRWREATRRWFSLDRGIASYDGIYRSLAGKSSSR